MARIGSSQLSDDEFDSLIRHYDYNTEPDEVQFHKVRSTSKAMYIVCV